MSKLVIVEGDKVEGKDQHNVSGTAENPSPPPPNVAYTGVGDFDYIGKITDQLSDFVTVDSVPVATLESKSSLNPGEVSPSGNHAGPNGSNWNPAAPSPTTSTLSITDTIGEGVPNSGAGSTFVTIDGVVLLLDGDIIDTCHLADKAPNSTVTSEGQDFVTCSE